MRHRLLEDIALVHRDALEANQTSPTTLRFYEQRQETAAPGAGAARRPPADAG